MIENYTCNCMYAILQSDIFGERACFFFFLVELGFKANLNEKQKFFFCFILKLIPDL